MADAAHPIRTAPARPDRLMRRGAWTALVTSALTLAAPSAQAQQPANSGPSFEASLKKFCPAKNLEFLKPDVLAKTTDAFVEQLPPAQNKQVKELSRPGVEACSGAADESCRTAAVLGTIRFTGLSEDLARRFCALPLACQDWFTCTEVAEAPRPAPGQPAGDNQDARQSGQEGRQARQDQQALPQPPEPDDQTAALTPRPQAQPVPPPVDRRPPARPEQPPSMAPAPQDDTAADESAEGPNPSRRQNQGDDYARGPDAPETAVPPRRAEPAVPPPREPEPRLAEPRGPEPRQPEPRYAGPIAPPPLLPAPSPEAGATDGRSAVAGFYNALGRGDGIEAARYLIPSKRGRGPFSAAAMERFYGSLLQPLRLMDVQQIGPSTLRARYSFVTRDRAVCNGDAIIAVRPSPEGTLIESIRALSGC